MKKAFDQTVRDIKREVNKKVLKVPGIEQKVHDATCNEPWGPHGSLLADIAQATRNYNEYQKIMIVLWKRINDTGKNWRHVYKALLVLEYLVAQGSERVIDDIREHAYQISTLSDFQYIDSGGRDQGNNVRKKSQSLVALVNDEGRIQHVRQKALANRDKYRNLSSTGGMHRPSSYSSTGSGDRDRYDDRNYESHYGEDGNGYGREGEWASRDDDRYDRGGDRNGTASYKYDGRGGHKDDDYRGNRGSDGYGSINRSFERERDHHYDDNESYGGGKADDLSPDERRSDHKLSQQTTVSPPSYDAAVNGTQSHVQDERDGAPPAPKIPFPTGDSPPVPKEFSPPRMSPPAFESGTKEIDAIDEFDPRSFVAAFSPSPTTAEMDIFGLTDSLAIVPVTSLTSEASAATNSDFGPNFVPLSSASVALNQPSEDPFGDNPFKAVLADDNLRAQPRSILQQSTATTCEASVSLQPAAAENLQRFTYAPSNDHNILLSNTTMPFSPLQQSGPETTTPLPSHGPSPSLAGPLGSVGASLPPPVPMSRLEPVAHFSFPTAPSGPTLSPFGSHASSSAPNGMLGATASVASYAPRPTAANGQLTPQSPIASLAHFQSPPPTGLSATAQQPKDKFEPKSTVWADTLSRGLVDFNISGSKINPLADIGIDFDSMNRREKRERGRSSSTPVTSTITMGKAMGSGSGIGRAGATGLAPSSNAPIMGSNMGMGMRMGGGAGTGGGLPGVGMGMGMGMGGYGGGMNQSMGGMGMGMNMGMVQGAQSQHPSAAGIPSGYNPMMGTYTSQQQYSGYR